MKKIILIYIFCLMTVFIFATMEKTYDWHGTLSDFEFSSDNSIQLNTKVAGKSYLTTQSSRCLNTQWEFDVRLNFNPSSSNYMDVYLSSENDLLTENTNGYFVRIGYTNDNICLYRKEGSKITRIIEGISKRLDRSFVHLSIKIACSSKAEWQLYSKLNEENEYTEEGNCTDFFHFEKKYFGFLCVYTATRTQGFRFDNLNISILDEEAEGHLFELEKPEVNDVVFNEIMFNGTEYIEFYNRSSKVIDMSQLYFAIQRNNGNLSTKIPLSSFPKSMNPTDYVVLTKNKEALCSEFSCGNQFEITESEKMPQLSNTGANLVLLNTDSELIDEFVYSDKMHQELIMNKKNIALERINPDWPRQDTDNWQTASFDSGYGTPGYINSQYLVKKASMEIRLMKDVFRFCGQEEVLFEYITEEPGTNALVLLFNSQGRVVKNIANNVLIGTSGRFSWDGLDDGKNNCEAGIYILYIEVISLNGKIFKTKKAFTLSKC